MPRPRVFESDWPGIIIDDYDPGHSNGTVAQGRISLDSAGSNDLHFTYYAVVGK